MKQRDDKRNTIDDTPQMVQCSVSHNSLRGGTVSLQLKELELQQPAMTVINLVKPT